ncbi:MAG: DUF3526 domain-containing protein [Cytophagia bacterium]|nr:MAG: DUF3526 domain-containing protein [Cytophagia bacterium]TAG44629.1 MAG: DUF3526 domain-containing protein [Cytophagia bacterium]
MIIHIAKKEFTQALRDNRFRLLAIFLGVLLAFAMLVSWSYYQKINEEHTKTSKTARQQWNTQTPKNPHAAAHYGTFAFKPIQTLSLIDNGLDKYLGVSVFLEGHRQNMAEYKQITEQNDLARFAELTPAFVFSYLVPLLIILLSFNIFTTEKENGTLKLLLSQGVSILQLSLGKIIGLWTLLAMVLLPIFGLGFVLLLASSYQNDDVLRYLMLIFSLILYYGIFINICVGVSAYVSSSNTSLVTLLGFWIISTLLIPKLTTNISKKIYPTPSVLDYKAQLKEDLEKGVDGHNPFSRRSQIFQDSVLKANKVDSIQKLLFNYAGLIMQAGEEHETVVYAKALKKLNDIYFAQLKIHEASAILSPTILFKMFSMQLAKTDLATHYDFSAQAEKYRVALVRDLNYDIKDNSKNGDWEYISKDKDFFKKNIQFQYKPISITQTLQQGGMALVYLMFWFLGTLLFILSIKKIH